jgi:hypothetical protein
MANLPPNSSEGMTKPKTAAQSITPEANAKIQSESFCDTFLKRNPSAEPITVAPPTPRAVNNTTSIVKILRAVGLARLRALIIYYSKFCGALSTKLFEKDKNRYLKDKFCY